MYRGENGIVAGRTFFKRFSTAVYTGISNIAKLVKGTGLGYTIPSAETIGNFLFAGDSGNSQIYQSYLGAFAFENIYCVMGQNWFAAGMAVDQKNRLLYPGYRYLGMFDPTVANYVTGTVQVTNGSANVVGTGTTFAAGDVGKVFRIVGENNAADFYKILTFTDATHIVLATNFAGTSGSGKSYVIYRAWTDQWKDFGSELTSVKIPTEIYEDTVLFGRNNNILTLNVLTNTITTDSVPAFTTPSGFVSHSIVANITGILLGWNFQGKGVLMLWDNYSDRSIAPWIRFDDLLLQVVRATGGWVIVTTKGIYFTNGYSIQILAEKFLGSSNAGFRGGTADNALTLGNQMYFFLSNDGKNRRAGIYKLDLKTIIVEYYGVASQNQFDTVVNALLYSVDFSRLYLATGTTIESLVTVPFSTETYSFETGEIGQGENMKVAEGLKVPLGLGQVADTSVFTFNLAAKISTLDRATYLASAVKSTSSALDKITIDETVQPIAQQGDEVEFTKGGVSQGNNGCIRNITSITEGGTNAAVYTLDAVLPTMAQANDNFVLSGYKLIEKKSYTALTKLPDPYFDIKNRYKAKSFSVKYVVTNANCPIEIQPFQFIYDDLGALQ